MTREPTAPSQTQRLDKWLWFARVVKSRTSAAELVAGGKVRVNRVRVVKPSHLLRAGDVLTVLLHGKVQVLEVLDPGTRRGPAEEARLLYRAAPAAADDSSGAGNPHPGVQAGSRSRR